MSEMLRQYGLVLGSHDFKEKDKIIDLFTAEHGLLKVTAKSIKAANAKLKYAKEFLSFGVFDIAQSKSFNVLTSCEIIEDFPEIRKDPEKYIEATNIIKLLYVVGKHNHNSSTLLLEFVNALKILNYENIEQNLVFAKMFISTFEFLGYKLNYKTCSCCGMNFYGRKFLNIDTGEIVCSACSLPYFYEVSEEALTNLRILLNTDLSKLSTLKLKNLNQLLKLLVINIKRLENNIKF